MFEIIKANTWKQRKLGDLLKIKSGMSQKNIEVDNGKFPILATGGEIGRTNTPLYTKESVLIGRKGTIDKPVYMNTPFWTVDTLFYSELFTNVVGRFIYALFQKIKWRYYDTSTGVPSLTSSTIHAINVHIPESLAEQKAIGKFFKQLDSTIDFHQRTQNKYKNLKIAYLQTLFHNNSYAWVQRKLGDVVEIVGGGTPDTNNKNFWGGKIDWYSPTEIGNHVYATGSQKSITQLGLEKSSAKILPANKTILFTSRAGIGDMAILLKDGATNQGFQSLVVNDNIDIYFLYSLGSKIKEFALKNASGSTFLEISKNELAKMPISLPTLTEQQAIGEFFRQLDDTITTHQRELLKYQQLKEILLKKMFV